MNKGFDDKTARDLVEQLTQLSNSEKEIATCSKIEDMLKSEIEHHKSDFWNRNAQFPTWEDGFINGMRHSIVMVATLRRVWEEMDNE